MTTLAPPPPDYAPQRRPAARAGAAQRRRRRAAPKQRRSKPARRGPGQPEHRPQAARARGRLPAAHRGADLRSSRACSALSAREGGGRRPRARLGQALPPRQPQQRDQGRRLPRADRRRRRGVVTDTADDIDSAEEIFDEVLGLDLPRRPPRRHRDGPRAREAFYTYVEAFVDNPNAAGRTDAEGETALVDKNHEVDGRLDALRETIDEAVAERRRRVRAHRGRPADDPVHRPGRRPAVPPCSRA